MSNVLTYNNKEIVDAYAKAKFLFKGEKLLFEDIKTDLTHYDFLDIGIGGGRTTHYLANKCKSYTGVDYSEKMVESCKMQYPNHLFLCNDAADMNSIENEKFDCALFSFNGIDCVGLEHRVRIMKEVYRVLKPNALFIFSFHNALSLDYLFDFHLPKNPLNWIKEYTRVKNLKIINGSREKYRKLDFFILKDGAENFNTDVMYLKPDFQADLVHSSGFKIIKCIETESGKILDDNASFSNSKSSWIYLLCQKR